MGLHPETLDLLQKTAVQAAGAEQRVHIVQLPGERGRYLLVNGEKSEIREADPPARTHTLRTVQDVVRFVKDAMNLPAAEPAEEEETLDAAYDPVVYFDESGIVAILDDGGRREDKATVTFKKTLEYQLLEKPLDLDQKTFVRLFRTQLGHVVPNAADVIRVARAINFSETMRGQSQVGHGRDSMGHEIESQVGSDAGELPETIDFNVRVFDDPTLTARHSVRVSLEIDPKAGTFRLVPVEDQLRNAMDAALDGVRSQLAETEAPVYFGRP